MSPQSVIRRKRDGEALSASDIQSFVDGAVSGAWTGGQTGSMLMAMFQQGMSLEETRLLLQSMLHSGDTFDFSDIPVPKADKHSTGGVGDKVSLVLAPLAASCGLAVPMLSGRGLGHTGGTLDKLESIPGFNVFLSPDEIHRQVAEIGCVIAGQTSRIVPADKILYAMRDETATVENPSLVAASILSKKLAEGIDALLLDVKFGKGAFFTDIGDAEHLAHLMVDLGKAAGCRVCAWLTCMDSPLGRAVGNAVEVQECIDILKGCGPQDLTRLIVEEVGGMLVLAGLAEDLESAVATADENLANGAALEKFTRMVESQGGNIGIIDGSAKFPQAEFVTDVLHSGADSCFIEDVDARKIAEVVLQTGAGRQNADDTIDPAAGISNLVIPGDRVNPGGILARLHHSSKRMEDEWIHRIRKSITLAMEPPGSQKRVFKRIN